MIRILVIDDVDTPDSLEKLKREIEGSYKAQVNIASLNPVKFITGKDEVTERKSFLQMVSSRASEFWDIAFIDLNLSEVEMKESERLDLPLAIVEAFREANRAASVMLYSGTLAKHIPKLIDEDNKSAKRDSERLLKRIFLAGIGGFVPRDEISSFVHSLLDEPPWLLRVDRLLTANSKLTINVKESEFYAKGFGDLASCVRRLDKTGKRIAELVAQFGVSSFVDLNT